MTIREAFIQALKEEGESEQTIKETIRYADLQNLQNVAETYQSIPVEDERKLVEAFREIIRRSLAIPISERVEFIYQLQQRQKKRVMNQ